MVFQKYLILLVATTSVYAAPASLTTGQKQAALVSKEKNYINNDLKTASSSYSHQYSDWGGRNPGGYGYSVTGYGTIDDKYTADPLYKGFNGYDNSLKYNSYPGYGNDGNLGYSGYKGSDGFGPSRFGPTALEGNLYGNEGIGYSGGGYGIGGTGNSIGGYGGSGYGGYGTSGYGGYGGSGYGNYGGGYGGYGGYGGNGGLNSYNGYNNPHYQGAGHLGYGYQAKKLGYGNIYNSGITPSLVTGYRGYTRR